MTYKRRRNDINEYGQIVLDCWLDLPNHYDNIILGQFQIMPNHIHCIIGVDNSKIMIPESNHAVETGFKPVSTEPVCTANNAKNINPDKKNHGVFEFIRALKSFSSRRINEKRNSRGVSNCQERFHDHIIRNEAEYDRIKNYIINNPKKWDEDCFLIDYLCACV